MHDARETVAGMHRVSTTIRCSKVVQGEASRVESSRTAEASFNTSGWCLCSVRRACCMLFRFGGYNLNADMYNFLHFSHEFVGKQCCRNIPMPLLDCIGLDCNFTSA